MRAEPIGALRHRVTFYTVTETRGTAGEAVPATASLGTVWAKVEPLGGRELIAAQQIHADITVKVTVRYYSGLATVSTAGAAKHQIVFGARTFDIQAVQNIEERGRYLVFLCVERQ